METDGAIFKHTRHMEVFNCGLRIRVTFNIVVYNTRAKEFDIVINIYPKQL